MERTGFISPLLPDRWPFAPEIEILQLDLVTLSIFPASLNTVSLNLSAFKKKKSVVSQEQDMITTSEMHKTHDDKTETLLDGFELVTYMNLNGAVLSCIIKCPFSPLTSLKGQGSARR